MAPSDPAGMIDVDGVEWIPAPRAAALIPSPSGRRTHLNSVRRWVAQKHLRGRRMTRFGKVYLWVALADVLKMRELDELPEKAHGPSLQMHGTSAKQLRGLFPPPRKRKVPS